MERKSRQLQNRDPAYKFLGLESCPTEIYPSYQAQSGYKGGNQEIG